MTKPAAKPAMPAGLYDQLQTLALLTRLDDPSLRVERDGLGPETASAMLSQHVATLVSALLSSVGGKDAEKLSKQIELTNQLLDWLASQGDIVDSDDHVTAERLLQVAQT